MTTEIKTDVPTLDPSNYGPWLLALRAAAFNTDSIDHLDGNPAQPAAPEELKRFLKKKNYLLGKIITTIPNEIANLLIAPDSNPTPHNLVTQIKAHLNTTNANDHKYLKSIAEATHFLPEMTLPEYVEAHEKIRAKMIASQYPSISDAKTTVEFMIDGLKQNPSTAQIGLQLIALQPADVKEFTQQFNRIYSYQEVTSSFHQGHGLPSSSSSTSDLQEILRLLRRGNKEKHQPHLSRDFKACSFHVQKGVPRPRHTDDQCRDPDHPKNHRANRNRRGAAARAINTENLSAILSQLQDLTEQNTGSDAESDDDTDAGTFLLDSAAHPTHISTPTKTMTVPQTPLSTTTATNQRSPCTHRGKVTIKTGKRRHITVPAVANPTVKNNLLSVRAVAQQYGPVIFNKNNALLLDTRCRERVTVIGTAMWDPALKGYKLSQNHQTRARGARTHKHHRKNPKPGDRPTSDRQQVQPTPPIKRSSGGKPQPTIPHLPDSHQTPRPKISNILTRTVSTPYQRNQKRTNARLLFHDWHLKLNHTSPSNLQTMAARGTIPTMPTTLTKPTPNLTCSSCAFAKQRPAAHRPNTKHYEVGTYISSDTCGPINPPSRQGNRHFLSFIDAASRYLILYFLKDRREVSLILPVLFTWLTSTGGKAPQIYRTDNAKEFCSKSSTATYQKHGIEHRTNTPHQPQQNSRAERINQTLMNAARAALHHSQLDDTHWEDAVRDAAFKYNLMLHSAHGKSPYEHWYGHKPIIQRLFAFGQIGHITIHSPKKKLQARAAPARYLYGTSESHICVMNLHSGKHQTVRERDFHPYSPSSDPTNSRTQAFQATTATPQPHRADPQSHAQAKTYEDRAEWAIAHDKELDNLDANNTIEWIPDNHLTPSTTLIPLKMTYRYKTTPTGDITRKARCSVRGDRMQPGRHYDPENTTTYMAEKATVRLILAISAAHKWPVEHFDITAAYLHEQYKHDKPVYIRQHQRFDGTFKHKCKTGVLRGNLYGTPPASNIYFTALVKHLTSAGYQQCHADPCLFYKHNDSTGDTTLVAISMDDFLATANKSTLISELYAHLSTKYNIKRLGSPSMYLNWKVQTTPTGAIHISQPHTINAILSKTNMTNCNPKTTPLPEKIDQQAANTATPLPCISAAAYRQTIGDLRYVADSTRPDIYHAVNRLAATMHNQPIHIGNI